MIGGSAAKIAETRQSRARFDFELRRISRPGLVVWMQRFNTITSVLFIVGPKCTAGRVASSHAAPWWVTVSMPTGRTEGRTSDHHYFTLSDWRGQRKKRQRLLRCPVKQRSVDVSTQWSLHAAVVSSHQLRNPYNQDNLRHDSDIQGQILAAGGKADQTSCQVYQTGLN